MSSMLNRLYTKAMDNAYEILLLLAVVTILSFFIYRYFRGSDGTWTKKKYYEQIEIREPVETYKPNTINQPYQEVKVSNDSIGETECRRVLSKIFNRPFLKARPDFLRNPVTGNNFNLELDCYDESLKLAVEYNGRQHYDFIPYFHKNNDRFLNQKYRDDMKRRMCKDMGITLIEVPFTVDVKEIENFLVNELRKTGYL
jgi:hypothetical protein